MTERTKLPSLKIYILALWNGIYSPVSGLVAFVKRSCCKVVSVKECNYSYVVQNVYIVICNGHIIINCRSQWPRVLRRRSSAARLLRSWVRILPGVWMFVCCECCVLSGRGLCDGLITRPEESYRLWCVVGPQRHKEKKYMINLESVFAVMLYLILNSENLK